MRMTGIRVRCWMATVRFTLSWFVAFFVALAGVVSAADDQKDFQRRLFERYERKDVVSILPGLVLGLDFSEGLQPNFGVEYTHFNESIAVPQNYRLQEQLDERTFGDSDVRAAATNSGLWEEDYSELPRHQRRTGRRSCGGCEGSLTCDCLKQRAAKDDAGDREVDDEAGDVDQSSHEGRRGASRVETEAAKEEWKHGADNGTKQDNADQAAGYSGRNQQVVRCIKAGTDRLPRKNTDHSD